MATQIELNEDHVTYRQNNEMWQRCNDVKCPCVFTSEMRRCPSADEHLTAQQSSAPNPPTKGRYNQIRSDS